MEYASYISLFAFGALRERGKNAILACPCGVNKLPRGGRFQRLALGYFRAFVPRFHNDVSFATTYSRRCTRSEL